MEKNIFELSKNDMNTIEYVITNCHHNVSRSNITFRAYAYSIFKLEEKLDIKKNERLNFEASLYESLMEIFNTGNSTNENAMFIYEKCKESARNLINEMKDSYGPDKYFRKENPEGCIDVDKKFEEYYNIALNSYFAEQIMNSYYAKQTIDNINLKKQLRIAA